MYVCCRQTLVVEIPVRFSVVHGQHVAITTTVYQGYQRQI